jgi:hypothetical protein
MLRVTPRKEGSIEIWDVEGKIAGDWVKELERCWREHSPEPGIGVRIHLKSVTFIDAAGKKLLAEMHRQGMEIKGCGCMARAVVEDIEREAEAKASQKPRSGFHDDISRD